MTAAIEAGARGVLGVEGKTSTDVSAKALKRLQIRLKQVEQLIDTFEAD